MKKHLFLSLALLLSTIISLAAPSSLPEYVPSTGRDFWVTFLQNRDVDMYSPLLRIYFLSEENATVNVTPTSTGATSTISLTAGVVSSFEILNNSWAYTQTSGIQTNTGIHVTADKEISVYTSNLYRESSSAISYDLSPIIATSSLGKEYIIQTYPNDKVATEMAVVATEDGTEVQIVFSRRAKNDNTPSSPFMPGETKNITLNKGQVYQVKSINGSTTMSGTTILADKPIAVFSGGVNAGVPDGGAFDGDHVYEQVIPLSAAGKRFVLMNFNGFPSPLPSYSALISESTRFVFTGIYDDTELKVISGGAVVGSYDMNKGTSVSSITVGYAESPKFVEATKPVLCYAYTPNAGQNYIRRSVKDIYGDYIDVSYFYGEPSMILIPSVRQGLNKAVFPAFTASSFDGATTHYVNVIVPDSAKGNMKLNGVSLPASTFSTSVNRFSDRPNVAYAYARISMPAEFNTLTNDKAPFLSFAYGLSPEDPGDNTISSAEGYAMATTFNLAPAAPEVFIGGEKMNHNDVIDFCNRHPGMDFSANVDYVHDSVRWDYGDGNSSTSINSNHIYNILVNGQSQTNIVKFFVYHHDPLSGDKHIDTVKVTLNVHPTYYDTLVVDICGSEGSYHWTQSSDNFNNEHISKTFLPGNDALGVSDTAHNYTFDKNTNEERFDSIVYRTENWDCDSIFFLRLRIHPSYDIAVPTPVHVCQLDTFKWSGHTGVTHHWHHEEADSMITNQYLKTMTAGTYHIIDSTKTIHDCDSVFRLTLIVDPKPVVTLSAPAPICEENDPTLTVSYTSSDADYFAYTLTNSSDVVVKSDTVNPALASGTFNISVGDLPDGSYTIAAVATSDMSCTGFENSTTIIIRNKPAVSLGDIAAQCHPASLFTATYVPTDADSLIYTVKQGSTIKVAATKIKVPAAAPYSFDINTTDWAPATYTITAHVMSSYKCESDEVTKAFIINPKPTVSAEAENQCDDETSTTVTLTTTDAASFKYYIVGKTALSAAQPVAGSFSLDISSLDAGSYTLKVVANSATCVSDTADVPFTVYPMPTATITSTPVSLSTCAPRAADLEVAYTATNTDSIEWSLLKPDATTFVQPCSKLSAYPTLTVPKAQLTAPGDYTFTITLLKSDNGCTRTDVATVTFTQYDAATVTGGHIDSVCAGTANVVFPISTTYADTYSYSVDGTSVSASDQSLTNNGATPVATNVNIPVASLAAGTYTVRLTVTNSHNCGSSEAVQTFTVNPIPSFTLPATLSPICETEPSVEITLGSPASVSKVNYRVMKGAVEKQNVIGAVPVSGKITISTASLDEGDYTIYATPVSVHGCTGAEQSTSLTIYNQPLMNLTAPGDVCAETATLDVDYTTNDASTFSYTLLNSSSVTVAQENNITAATTGTISLDVNALPVGSYTLRAQSKSDNDCLSTWDEVTFDVLTKPKAAITSVNSLCANGAGPLTFTVNYTTTNATTYKYYVVGKTALSAATEASASGSFSFTLSGLAAGDYTVKLVANSANCVSDTASAVFTVYPRANFVLTEAHSACYPAAYITFDYTEVTGEATEVSWNILSEEKYGMGSWTSSDYLVSGSFAPTTAGSFNANTSSLPAGSYRMLGSFTTAHGCSNTFSDILGFTIYNQPTASIAHIDSVCYETPSVPVSLTTTYATDYTYSVRNASDVEVLSGAGTTSGSTATPALTNITITGTGSLAAGKYSVVISTTNANSCGGEDVSETFTINPQPVMSLVVAGHDAVCQGDASLEVPFTQTNTATFTFRVEKSGEVVLAESGDISAASGKVTVPTATLAAGDDYVLYVTPKSEHGCTNATLLSMPFVVHPTFAFDETVKICQNDAPYLWHGKSLSTSGVYTNDNENQTTIYGCDSIYTLNLTVYPKPTINIVSSSVSMCQGSPSIDHYAIHFKSTNSTIIRGSIWDDNNNVVVNNSSSVALPTALADAYFSFAGSLAALSAGNYRIRLVAYNEDGGHSCPSDTASVPFVIHPTYEIVKKDTICDTAPYEWLREDNSVRRTIPAGLATATVHTFYDSLTTIYGCDSVYVLQLRVESAEPIVTNATICYGESYDWTIADHPCTHAAYTIAKNLTASCTLLDTITCPGAKCNQVYRLNLTVRSKGATVVDAPHRLCQDEIFSWRGMEITEPGVYETLDESDLDANSCPRNHRITVTRLEPVTKETFATICYGEPYTFAGHTYTTLDAGQHVMRDTIRTATDCDSIYLVLRLTVGQHYLVEETQAACDSYLWRGKTLTLSGNYADTLASINGCDSIYVLHLTVNKSYSYTETYSVALSEMPFTVHEFTYDYSVAGTYNDTRSYQTVAGCDSLYHITLNVYDAPIIYKRDTTDRTICAGGTCTWRGNNYTAAGQYSVTDADSIHLLRLSHDDTYLDTLYIHTCAATGYYFNGSNRTTSGTYVYNGTTIHGCDSVVVLKLTVAVPSPVTNIAATACRGDLFSWGGESFVATVNRTLRDTLLNVAGCDSVIVLTLTVNNYSVAAPTDASICEGDSYLWASNGKSYSVPGTYSDTVAGGGSCGTIHTLNLTVNPSYEFFDDVEVREEIGSYAWRGHNYVFDGIHYEYDELDSYTTIHGCDSVYRLHLHVVPEPPEQNDFVWRDTLIHDACDSYTWRGQNLTVDGLYSDTVWKAGRYDTVHFLDLTIHTGYVFYEEDIISCDNEIITWHCDNYTPASGYYTVTKNETSIYGCDSIYHANIRVHATYRDTAKATMCQYDIYTWRGKTLSPDAGSYLYSDTLTSLVSGCDSIYFLSLTVTPRTLPDTTEYTMCNLASYDWQGYHIANKEAGDHEYYKYYTPTGECETFHYLLLHVEDVTPDTTHAAVCYGEPYDWWVDTDGNGSLDRHVQSGIYVPGYQYDTVAGGECNKVFVLDLTVYPAPEYKTQEEAILCTEGIYTWRGQTYNASGVYHDTISSHVTGCDSIIFTLNLVDQKTKVYNEAVHRCYGETFTWPLKGTTYTASATDKFVVPSLVTGCDSIVYNLTVDIDAAALEGEESVILCADYYTWHGTVYTSSGDYVDVVTSSQGCDSTCTLHLILSQDEHFYESVVIKDTQLPYTWHEDTYTAAGNYTQAHQNIYGCDSTYHLNLIVSPLPTRAVKDTICEDELPYTWNLNGLPINTYASQGSYLYSTTDTIYTLDLKVCATYVPMAETKTICDVDLPYLWHGQTLTVAGVYTDAHVSSVGCDSVYTLTLNVTSTSATVATMTLCEGEVFNWGSYFELLPAGTYARTATFPSLVTGCDSTVNLTLTIVGPTTVNALETQTICSSELPYLWRGHSYDAAGLYGDTIVSVVNGCDSVLFSLCLIVNDGFYEYNDVEINEDAVPYYWNGHDMLVSEEGTYFDSYSDINGCDSVYELHLHLNFYQRDTTWADGTHSSDATCDSYTWRGKSYTESGLYTDTVKSANPVEIHYLSLVVNQSVYAETEIVKTCGTSYMWHGEARTSGVHTYIATGVAANGCDSVYTLDLTLYPEYNIIEPALTICDNEYVYWQDTMLHTVGTYVRRFTTIHGCDSVRSVTVNVNPTSETIFRDTICATAAEFPYLWRSLTINTLEATASRSDYYTYYDNNLTPASCDSVHVLRLYVWAPSVFHDTVSATVCEGETYAWYGNNSVFVQQFVVDGTKEYKKQFGDGVCVDSLYVLNLTMKPIGRDTVRAALCGSSDTYAWAGDFLDTPGIYRDTLTADNGCDSIRVLILSANPDPVSVQVNHVGCPGDVLNYTAIPDHPFVYSTPGEYKDTVVSVLGCDSIYIDVNFSYSTINTHVSEVFKRQEELPYMIGTEIFSTPNVFNFELNNFHGCPEPYTLTLHVLTDRYDTVYVHACAGEGKVVNFYGTDSLVYPTGTGVTLVDTAISVNPMELDTVRHLTVISENISFQSDTTIYALVGSPIYTWQGHTLTIVGETTPVPAALTTTAGVTDYYHRINCDSVYYLHFNVIDTPKYVDTDTVCPTDLPYTWHSQTVAAGASTGVEHVLTDISIVSFGTAETFNEYDTLRLFVNPSYNIVVPDTFVLQNAVVPFYGGFIPTDTKGPYTIVKTGTASNGCDSVMTRTAQVVKYVVLTEEICDGDVYSLAGIDFNYPVDTTIMFPLGTTALDAPADSVYRLQLIVQVPTKPAVIEGRCNLSSLPYEWRGKNYSETGVYYDTVYSGNGCAAEIHTLDLVVGPLEEFNDTLCAGETMTWGTATVTAPTPSTDFIRNDTTFRLHLYAAPSYSFSLDTTIYIGPDRPTVFNWTNENGATIRSFPTADQKADKFFGTIDSVYATSAHGCDSIYHLTLRVYGDTTITEKDTICADQVLSWHCKMFDGADKMNTNVVLYDSLTTWYGADSVYVLNLHITDSCMPKPAVPVDTVICHGESFDWIVNGTLVSTYTISAVDTYVDDSIYTLSVKVLGDYSEIYDEPDTILYGEMFTWHGDNYAGLAEGDHLLQKSYTTYRGNCDSIYKVNLYVKPLEVVVVDSVEYDTICAGDFYDWYVGGVLVSPNGYHISSSGTYTTQYTSYNIPPIADTTYKYTLHLEVRDVDLRPEYQQIPNDGVFVWSGHYGNIVLSNDTVISDTLRYEVGYECDSVVWVLNLSKLPPTTYSDTTAIFCQSTTAVMWGAEVLPINNLGTFTATIRTNNHMGGDSIITLTYTVVAAAQYDSVHVISPLDGGDYTWNGHSYHANMDTTFIFNGTSYAGCDSVATLRVMTGLLSTDTAYAKICPTETTYHWQRGGLDTTFVDVTTGLYYGIKPNYTPGFDSVIVLSLTKLETDTLHVYDTTCYDPYVTVNPLDTVYMQYANMGCDSVAKIFHHYVVTQLHENVIDTVVQGSNFVWGSQSIADIKPQNVGAGNPDYVFINEPFTSVFGCDSTVTLWLYVAPKYDFYDTVRICLGNSYTWPLTSQTFTPELAGMQTYKRVFKTVVYNTDSVYNLTLITEQPYSNIMTVAIEADSVLQWRGRTLSETGYYYDSLTSMIGCDSVYGLQLYVGRISHDTVRATICDGDIFNWDVEPGVTLQETTSGFHYYSMHFDGPPAFDSILVLDLMVNPSYEYVAELHVAQDSIFIWDEDGQQYDTHAVGMQTLSANPHTALGCDSILNLNLHVEPTYFIQHYDTICEVEGMSLLAYDSVRTEYGTTTYGFDSIVEYNLFVHGTPVVYEYDTVCHSADDVVMWHEMNLAQVSSTIEVVYENGGFDLSEAYKAGKDTILYATEQFRPGVYDCDTLFTLNLHVNPDYLFIFRDTIPDSEVYGRRWRDTLGVPELDSIPQLDPLQTPQVFDFYDTLTSVYGCDSVYKLELLVGPTFKFEEELSTCDNDSICWHDSIWYVMLPEGIYYDTLVYKTTLGYDSVYTLTLTVNPMRTYEWSDTICPTDQALCGSKWITYHDSLGTDYENIVVEAWDTIQTYLGCDSICHLSLHFYMQYDTTTLDSVCYDTPFYWQPADSTYMFHEHGVYTDSVVLQTIHGCDSILRLELYVENLWRPDTTISICIDDTLHWIHRDTLDLFISAGDSLTKYTYPTDSVGNFLFIDTIVSALGCVYYDTLHLMVVEPVVLLSAQVKDPYCADDNEMSIFYTIDTIGGEPMEYYLYFSDAAHAEGFADVEGESMAHTGTIVVQLPMFGRDNFPRPDTYEATLYLNNGSCRDTATMTSVTFSFDILYPSWFAEQHWNDYLAVLSSEGNKSDNNPNGYTFTAYQWYVNGEPIFGATDPMLYYVHGIPTEDMPHSEEIDTMYAAGSFYQVLLTREDDGKSILTCPITPQEIADKDVHNDWYFTVDHTFIDRNNPNLNILTNTTGKYYLYDAAGKLLASGYVPEKYVLDKDGNKKVVGAICTPAGAIQEAADAHNAYHIADIDNVLYVPGTYLLRIESDEPSPYTGRIVRRAVKLLVY